MTDSTTDPAYDSAPPNPQITFGDHLTDPEQREAVERDVATIVARYEEAGAQDLAAKAEQAQLVNALNAPLMKLIEEDPAARKARDDLRTRQLIVDQELPLTATSDFFTGPSRAALDERATPLAIRQPPFDFTWFWHRTNGSPPFDRVLNNENGHYRLEARSGRGLLSVPGGASTFVEAHAGFGLLFSPAPVTTDVLVGADSARTIGFAFDVGAYGIGANATTEGGMEFTVVENGILLTSSSAKLWRKRVSVDEEEHSNSGPAVRVFRPPELRFTMQAGREYTFNVGVWMYTDYTSGIGGAAARSVADGQVLFLTVWQL